jgi:hypothetical protein
MHCWFMMHLMTHVLVPGPLKESEVKAGPVSTSAQCKDGSKSEQGAAHGSTSSVKIIATRKSISSADAGVPMPSTSGKVCSARHLVT